MSCISNSVALGEPRIYLLWRHSLGEAMALAARETPDRHVVFVRLVNQAVDEATLQAATEQRDLQVVTLPMAFAGLHEQDQVLRHAVMQQLQDQDAPAALSAAH